MSSQDTIDELVRVYDLPVDLAEEIAALSDDDLRSLGAKVFTLDMGDEELAEALGVSVERISALPTSITIQSTGMPGSMLPDGGLALSEAIKARASD